ncbi:hypothetical protein MKEN_00314600 [Mycena kentingensis (nom. inval.)]|nr:hypothetical protein MKEN_00314600 [Mycena kentingensis (nom. inval.)]
MIGIRSDSLNRCLRIPPMVAPLLGDDNGVYRVHVVGNAGTGKSTVGRELAKTLNVPYIALDELLWKPGWEQETNEQFRSNVQHTLAAAPNGWVVDGNYSRRIGDVVEVQSTDEICKAPRTRVADF